jgi:hypothetical protein
LITKEKSTNDIALKLRKLWKGTIYIGISGIYILLLGMVLMFVGLKAALLTFFLIALVQLFRYVAGDVDRLGWVMENKEISGAREDTRKYQSKMLLLLFSLIQISNLLIIYQIYVISTEMWALIAFFSILAVELMFRQIRGLNHEIDYELASYGIKDRNPISSGANSPNIHEANSAEVKDTLDKKLEALKSMVEHGEITKKAYEEVRDRELIKRIMDE